MAYIVEFGRRASKDLDRLPPQIAREITEEISTLEENPLQGHNIRHLSGSLYRLKVLRVWRVGYLVEGSKVIIVLVGHRRDFYERLQRRV